ncbi:MAG TPA: lysylphosphatidylglycerol synthase transmembrane domain-containing protein [Burkholderiaceae bacterium]|nr:lysylphosphatidylglycerol synthase transmembrane domain-containing protein [Burkholderiaceae bacterium]
MNRRRAAAWAKIAAGALLVAAILWWADPRRVLDEVAGAEPAWLVAGLAASAGANLLSALRWRALAAWLGQRVGAIAATGLYFRAIAISALLPGAVVGGDVYRAVALNRRGQPALEAGLSVFLDRLSGLWILLVLGALAAAWGLSSGQAIAATPTALVAAGAGAMWAAAAGLLAAPALGWPVLRALAARRTGASASVGATWRGRIATVARRPGAGRQYGLQVFASLGVQCLSIGAFALGGRALGIELPVWAWAAAAVPVFLMATLPVSFGGWGTREAAAAVALAGFGVPAASAVGASVLYGLFALAQAVAGGLLLISGRREAHRLAGSEHRTRVRP